MRKIADFKLDFMPNALPREVIESGNFRLGDKVTREAFYQEQRAREQASL